MDQEAIIRYVADSFSGVDVQRPRPGDEPEIAVGDTFFIYDPERNLEGARRFPFATLVTKDYGEFDNRSNLDRPGVFRLNIGIGRDSYRRLFGAPPPRPGPDGTADIEQDASRLDHIMPHPVYAPQAWVCVLNPSKATFEAVKPLLAEAYALAVSRLAKSRSADAG